MSQYLVNKNRDDSQDHVTHTVNELQKRCEEQEKIISRLLEYWEKSEQEKRNVKRELQKVCDKLTDSKNAYKHLHNMYELQNYSQRLKELELKHSKKQLDFIKSVVHSFERIGYEFPIWEQFKTSETQYKTAKEELEQWLRQTSKYDKFPAWIYT